MRIFLIFFYNLFDLNFDIKHVRLDQFYWFSQKVFACITSLTILFALKYFNGWENKKTDNEKWLTRKAAACMKKFQFFFFAEFSKYFTVSFSLLIKLHPLRFLKHSKVDLSLAAFLKCVKSRNTPLKSAKSSE